MLIAVLGVIVLMAGKVLKRSPEPNNRFVGVATTVGIILVVLALGLSSFKIIEPGKVGVQTLLGKVQDNILESGHSRARRSPGDIRARHRDGAGRGGIGHAS